MSDVEEPPTKMSKYEEYLDPEGEECLEEGQEEWLSEGVLTDDDYVQMADQTQEQDISDVNIPTIDNQETTQVEEESDTIQTTTVIGQVELKDGALTHPVIAHGTIAHGTIAHGTIGHGTIAHGTIAHGTIAHGTIAHGTIAHGTIAHGTIAHGTIAHGTIAHGGAIQANVAQRNESQNIEEQLNNLESTHNGDELPDDLDAFLIRKADGQVLEAKANENHQAALVKQEDDGNDTDDLLRMLSEGDQKAKKKTFKVVKTEKLDDQGSSDDDDFIYERSQVKTLKLAKNALIKRTATKAVPEDMSDGDDESERSSDEGSTVQRMFEVKKPPPSGKKPEPKKIVKHVVQVNTGVNRSQKPEPKVNSKPSVTNQKPIPKAMPKLTPKPGIQLTTQQKPSKFVEIKTPTPFKPLDKTTSSNKSTSKVSKSGSKDATSKNEELDEIINEEEFLEDDVSDLDEEEFGEDSEGEGSKRQRIMRPEMMDEEVPSDAESRSEDGSLYDELPSSDSEDLDDWFTLDIRAERAGDYLPLLGSKARDLLLAERRRVSTKVATLRESLTALTESARRQADQLRSASMTLAELDDTLRAA